MANAPRLLPPPKSEHSLHPPRLYWPRSRSCLYRSAAGLYRDCCARVWASSKGAACQAGPTKQRRNNRVWCIALPVTRSAPPLPRSHLDAEGLQLRQRLCQRGGLVLQRQPHACAQQLHLPALPARVLQGSRNQHGMHGVGHLPRNATAGTTQPR